MDVLLALRNGLAGFAPLPTPEGKRDPLACVAQGEDQLAKRLVVLDEVAAVDPWSDGF